MTATEAALTAEEWEKAMAVVMALQTEIPAGGGWVPKQPPLSKNTDLKEIPSDGPSGDSPITKPDKVQPEKWNEMVGRPQGKNTDLKEIPSDGPSGEAKTPADWARLDVDQMVRDAIDYGVDTATGWSSRGPAVSGTGVKWDAFPQGNADGTGPDGSTYKSDTLNRTPRTSLAKLRADEDLDHDTPDNLSLPDGSFFTATVDDLKNNIDKVKNADQANPRQATHPWYADVKSHLARRAAAMGQTNLVPPDWQLSMGKLVASMMARDIDSEARKALAAKGQALPDGSYPIGDAHDLKNAMILARSGHGDVAGAKKLIKRRAKELDVDLPADFK